MSGSHVRKLPRIGVVMSTCERPGLAVLAVQSILKCDYPDFIVTVVDQSSDDQTVVAIKSLLADPRMHYVRQRVRGLSRGRNLGSRINHEHGAEILAYTDDDCEPEAGWLTGFADAFARDPKIGMVFGTTRAPEYDRAAGMIPAYEAQTFHTARNLADRGQVEGMGASMAVKTAVWSKLAGFDVHMGCGARFVASEEADFSMRALLAGSAVSRTPDAVVIHHGFRAWCGTRPLIQGYMRGQGALNIKMLRLGRHRALKPLAQLGWRWVSGKQVLDLNHTPPRWMRLGAFLEASVEAMNLPLTRSGAFAVRNRQTELLQPTVVHSGEVAEQRVRAG